MAFIGGCGKYSWSSHVWCQDVKVHPKVYSPDRPALVGYDDDDGNDDEHDNDDDANEDEDAASCGW